MKCCTGTKAGALTRWSIGSGSCTPHRGSRKPAYKPAPASSSGAKRKERARRAVSGFPQSAASTETVAARF
eukprot:8523860-Heterocapsa_arctica.AAC.1